MGTLASSGEIMGIQAASDGLHDSIKSTPLTGYLATLPSPSIPALLK